MELTRLTLADKRLFDEFFKKFPPEISEYTFTNLFIWDHYYHCSYTVLKGYLCIIACIERQPILLPPVGPQDGLIEIIDMLMEWFHEQKQPFCMYRVPESMAMSLIKVYPKLKISLDVNNSDYVYSTKDLIELKGRKYHSKKNFLNRFIKENNFEYKTLTENYVHACLSLAKKWLDIKNGNDEGLIHEYIAIEKALRYFNELKLRGGVILIDGIVEAFTLGEMLNPCTANIHIEKANPTIPGLYAAINQMFCQNAWNTVPYINREQDLGISGLRKAKQSYHPIMMINKYSITET